jgi:hypothetical protein
MMRNTVDETIYDIPQLPTEQTLVRLQWLLHLVPTAAL